MLPDKRLKKDSVELMPQSHPERLLLLGGAWFAMVVMGVMGMSALVNPERRLPVIDPLLETIAELKQQEPIFAPAPEDEKADKTADILSAIAIGQGYFIEPADSPSDAVSIANREFDTAAVADEMVDSMPEGIAASPALPADVEVVLPNNDVPAWIYWAIAASCIAGSSVITLFLYKVTSPAKTKKALSAQKHAKKRAAKVARTSAPPIKIPVIEVPPIAPLKISTPKVVQPPALKIEPVVDPQPAEMPKRSRADYLAQLARNAKQQQPKSLVEMMDVRRRNHLAPFS